MIHVVFIVVGGLIFAIRAYFMPIPLSKHEKALKNIKILERENKWLDARNELSQMRSPPWAERTR